MGWIERHRDGPFFMYLHVLDPHDPFEPRAPYDALWADPAKKEQHEAQLNKIRKEIQNPLLKAFGMPTKAEIEKAGVDSSEYVNKNKNWYDGSIRSMDSEIGRLMERLGQLGLDGKVQIAFISDHGEEFIEHGRMFHGQSVYGELTGVPMILYRPGVIPAGIQIKETVRNIDLMPTLLDLSGLPYRKGSRPEFGATDRCGAGRKGSGVGTQTLGWRGAGGHREGAIRERRRSAAV
jgi:arylsulfatase A-like enzyme